ncbi:MAG: GGDEF domain-containing protein, partial [Candidatus Aminicenantales bacterium]
MQLLDALTQVGNRRFLEIHLQSRLEELKKYRLPFGVIYADVDRLKNINATYGASVGDQVLHMVAQTFANNIRFFDLIVRWESDEFVVAVTNVDSNTLDLVANKLRLLVEKSGLMADEAMVRATVSLGAVPAHRVDDVETMLAKARELMRRSKWLGRNAVSLPQADENEPF